MQQDRLTSIIGGLSDLQASLTGNQAAREQIVALKNQVHDILTDEQEDREDICRIIATTPWPSSAAYAS